MDNNLSNVHLAMQAMLVVWLLLVLLIVRRTIRQGSVGLPAALVMTMTFLYGGCFTYAVPGYTHLRPEGHWYLVQYDFSEMLVVKATFASLLGLAGFAIGCGVFGTGGRVKIDVTKYVPTNPARDKRILMTLGVIAGAAYFLNYLRISFPLSGAALELGRNLGVVVICLGATLALRKCQSKVMWVFLAALIPAYYLLLFGFASYGFLFGTTLLAFWIAQLRPDAVASGRITLKGTLMGAGIIYAVLTLFIGWISFRDQFRLAIWNGQGSVSDALLNAVFNAELFSPWNFDSLDLINIRLNLNIFIGRMIEQHELFPELQQYGETLIILPLVLLPRFLWPGKPERGGSGFMSEHTGMTLSESATFGTGTVFEFFINFGYIGVFFGFMALGWVLIRIDRYAALHLQRGNFMAFARLYVMGILAIDPLLRPFFIVNGAVFAWLLMSALNFVLKPWIGTEKMALRGAAERTT